MKRLTFAVALLAVLGFAAGALAAPISFDLVGLSNANIRANVTLDYVSTGADTATASMFLTNTSTIPSAKVLSLAFSVPQAMNLVGSTGGIDGTGGQVHFQQPGGNYLYQPNDLTSRNTVTTPLLPGYTWDLSFGNVPSFAYGASDEGLSQGATAAFTLDLFGPGIGGLSTGAILASLHSEFGNDYGRYFAASFSFAVPAEDNYLIVNDLATPTPIPGAVWLLGSGLLGVMGFKRTRRGA